MGKQLRKFQSTGEDMHIQRTDIFAFEFSSVLFSFKNYSADEGVMRQALSCAAGGM